MGAVGVCRHPRGGSERDDAAWAVMTSCFEGAADVVVLMWQPAVQQLQPAGGVINASESCKKRAERTFLVC